MSSLFVYRIDQQQQQEPPQTTVTAKWFTNLDKRYGRTSSSSLLSQIHSSSLPPPEPPNPLSSPVLKALAGTPAPENLGNTSNPTIEWAKNIPFGRSPPPNRSHGPSVAGSPPASLQPHDELRGGFNNTSPPASPSATYRQPVRLKNGYQSFGDHLGSSPVRPRPVSMHSHLPQGPLPPHQPQAHFYGAPDIDFALHRHRSELNAPETICTIFDSLAGAGDELSGVTENVLLIGAEHELDVYRVDQKSFDRIGGLKDLRGAVHGAKILPSTSRMDPLRSSRPLVAVVIHGPHNANEPEESSRPGTSHSDDAAFDPSSSMLQALHNANSVIPKPTQYYQTTVEIYSLRKGSHVATLYQSPKAEVEMPRSSTGSPDCSPMGNVSIQAKGRFVTVGSGTSGEVYIFETTNIQLDDFSSPFRCLGKVWTRVSSKKTRSLSMSSPPDAENLHGNTSPKFKQPDVANFSLSHRWLAIVPPLASSQSTLHGIVDSVRSQKPPGFSSHTSPAEPQISCDLETLDGESMLSKVARDVTQEFIKGARWVGDQGKQAWNSYWTKPEPHSAPLHPPSNHSKWDPSSNQVFPPTHANNDVSTYLRKQPALVSILDLEKLSTSQNLKPAVALQPLATFALPDGCSLVSFSPSGLSILTASAKGDVQHIWDLLRMIHGETGFNVANDLATEKRPSVREIEQFTRMTVAKIIDVVWTEPRGERVAIVTERGTIHIFDLRPSAFQWPPPNLAKRSASLPSNPIPLSNDFDNVVPPLPTSSTLSAALDLVSVKTQPLLAAVRGHPPNIGNALAGLGGLGFSASAGAKSSKVVAAGFTKSVGAATGTVNTIRHMGENRLALPGSTSTSVPGSVRWLSVKDQGSLAAFGAGLLRIHSIRQSNNQKLAKRRPSVHGSKPIEFSLRSASNSSNKSGFDNESAIANHQSDKTSTPPHGAHWLSSSRTNSSSKLAKNNMAHPLSCAEIQTNAPYQPFHTDRRINFCVYSQDTTVLDQHHPPPGASPWAFGEPIAATKLGLSSAAVQLDENGQDIPAAQIENFISVEGNDEEGRQVVVTTRRKRGSRKTRENADEEFFEDDCEVVDFAEERV